MSDQPIQRVKIPTIEQAMQKRANAREFEGGYVPSPGPRLACLPAFDPAEDGVHVLLEAAGVRGRLLPLCAHGLGGLLVRWLLDVQADNPEKLKTIPKGKLQTAFSSEVTEDLHEIGGSAVTATSEGIFIHLHSITTERDVAFGPLDVGDVAEFSDRLNAAVAKLLPDAVNRSIVKIELAPPQREIIQPWQHGETP